MARVWMILTHCGDICVLKMGAAPQYIGRGIIEYVSIIAALSLPLSRKIKLRPSKVKRENDKGM